MKSRHFVILLLVGLLLTPVALVSAQDNPPVVHAVLFYSPTCGHCQEVINETLLPMMASYGEQLQILGIDVTQEYGQTLFLSALHKFNLDQSGVPFLVIDNLYLVGSQEIAEKFPSLVESYLAQGGIHMPDIPGLSEVTPQTSETDDVAVAPTSVSPIGKPEFAAHDSQSTNWIDNFTRDLAGNTLAVLVLAGMLASSGWTVIYFKKKDNISYKNKWTWVIPILCVIGFGVAGYLAYVETAQVSAVCGPVGDCNTVQQSTYVRLFGILPIGVLGLVGYATILVAWGISRFAYDRMADFATITLLTLTATGTLFSIYLTFLEPFVIGATCAWCLTSAVLMTVLMLLVVRPAKAAYFRIVSS